MISWGTSASKAICVCPARMMPSSSAAGIASSGWTRASRATVMPSKPRPTLNPAS